MSPLSEFDVSEDFAERLVAAVMDAWIRTTARRPWLMLSLKERVDHLPPLLRHLLRALFIRPSERYDRTAMVNEAARHGEQRRTLGFDEEAILHEYYVLRQLLWEELREAFGAVGAETVIARADVELSKAMAASVRGFHREALEAQGRWPSALSELSDPTTDLI